MKRKLKFHLTSYHDMRELSIASFSCTALLGLCFVSLALAATAIPTRLSYSEVEKLGTACPNLESCAYKRSTGSRELYSIKDRNCACDYLCSEYGDCCIDAPNNTMATTDNDWKCLELRQFGGVYMKDTCSPSYDGSRDIVEFCMRNKTDYTDPLSMMPVTDAVTGVTFKNYFCSMCNANSGNLVIWTPRLECPSLTIYNNSKKNLTNDYVFQNLEFDGAAWGLYLDGDNGSMFFHDCDIDPFMPLLLETKIRPCKPHLVSDCPPDWEDNSVRDMCKSYMGLRYLQGERYKNAHCALCNRINTTSLSCQSAEYRELYFFRTFERHAFSLLLDINEKSGSDVGLVTACLEGEIFDPFFKKCRSLICLPGQIKQGAQCVPTILSVPSAEFDVMLNDGVKDKENLMDELYPLSDMSFNETISNLSGISYNLSMSSEGASQDVFHNCLLITLDDDDYIKFSNRSIYVPKYHKTYEPTQYRTRNGAVLVCSHFEPESEIKFMPLMGYVTIVGLGISMLCLVLHSVAFCMVPDLQNLSGKNLVSQCFALFCAYCCFIVGQFELLTHASCIAVSFLTFYFFQVSFFWMSTMSFDVWRTLKMATTELRISGGNQWKRFAVYTFYSWITPLLIVTCAAFAEYTTLLPLEYRPGFAQPRCWFKHRRALLVFFASPLLLIMFANLLLFVSSARMIVLTTRTTIKQQSQSQKRNFKLYLRLALLMGLTWTVGLIAGYADIDILWYLFIVLNTLQGLFIFVAFSCSTKVMSYLRDKFVKHAKGQEFKSSSSHTASSGSPHASNTYSTNLHSFSGKKLSGKLLTPKKNSCK